MTATADNAERQKEDRLYKKHRYDSKYETIVARRWNAARIRNGATGHLITMGEINALVAMVREEALKESRDD